jgi:selenocysteine lyase/cysteine desulfurase
MPLDVETLGCDFLSATSRKYLRGPRGVGFLYARHATTEHLTPPFLDLHAARWIERDRFEMAPGAHRFENWESNIAAKLGMGAAVDYALAVGIEAIWERVRRQAARLRGNLSAIPGVSVHDLGLEKGGIVTFSVENQPAADVVRALRARAINTTSSTIFSTRFDMDARGLAAIVRASAHYVTTDAEIDLLSEAVAHMAETAG